jgi:hypothetical protein
MRARCKLSWVAMPLGRAERSRSRSSAFQTSICFSPWTTQFMEAWVSHCRISWWTEPQRCCLRLRVGTSCQQLPCQTQLRHTQQRIHLTGGGPASRIPRMAPGGWSCPGSPVALGPCTGQPSIAASTKAVWAGLGGRTCCKSAPRSGDSVALPMAQAHK